VFHEGWATFSVGAESPPPPTATLIGYGRSPHDTDRAFYSTKDNLDPTRFAWTYGGYLEFYASIKLEPPPSAANYRVRSRVTQWHYAGSPPYGDADVDLADKQPISILWSKYPLPDTRLHHYAYQIPRVGELVHIAVSVQYEYQYLDQTGQPVGPLVEDTVSGMFTLDLLYPQVLLPSTPKPGGTP
jgi:hypothetical protein